MAHKTSKPQNLLQSRKREYSTDYIFAADKVLHVKKITGR